jgi:5-(carboxyamino)imidazole ribonucleotide synthase
MRIAIVGAGQLGRMLALAGLPLGLEFRFLDRGPDAPAAGLGELVQGSFDDPEALRALVSSSDRLTFEFENVPAALFDGLPAGISPQPPVLALRCAQDRLFEKELFAELGIDSGPSLPVGDEAGLRAAVEALGLPAVLKTRRLGAAGRSAPVAGALRALRFRSVPGRRARRRW